MQIGMMLFATVVAMPDVLDQENDNSGRLKFYSPVIASSLTAENVASSGNLNAIISRFKRQNKGRDVDGNEKIATVVKVAQTQMTTDIKRS